MGRGGACSAGLTDWNGTDTESTGPGSCLPYPGLMLGACTHMYEGVELITIQ